MLLRFGVENWRSIRGYQELSFIASALKDSGASTWDVPSVGERVLPCAAIYGANASGKSNFLRALGFLQFFVENSHARVRPDAEIGVDPFKLDGVSGTKPSKFMLDFLVDGIRYEYSVALTSKEVLEESLYAYPKKRPALWYSRKGQQFEIGKSLKGEIKTLENVTRSNSLFLSAGATLNHAQLSEIYAFIRDRLLVADGSLSLGAGAARAFTADTRKQTVIQFLKAADVGICDLEIETIEPTEKDRSLFKEINAALRKHLPMDEEDAEKLETLNVPERHRVLFKHAGAVEDVTLELEDESRGTQRLLGLLAPALDALESGSTLVIDELDTSLHPLLARQLISLFQRAESNPKHAQLVFTTHDTNLLARNLLRRDQVWFAEKDRFGATCIYPLTDIKTRRSDNIERGYLEGRFGAVPYLGNFADLYSPVKNAAADGHQKDA